MKPLSIWLTTFALLSVLPLGVLGYTFYTSTQTTPDANGFARLFASKEERMVYLLQDMCRMRNESSSIKEFAVKVKSLFLFEPPDSVYETLYTRLKDCRDVKNKGNIIIKNKNEVTGYERPSNHSDCAYPYTYQTHITMEKKLNPTLSSQGDSELEVYFSVSESCGWPTGQYKLEYVK